MFSTAAYILQALNERLPGVTFDTSGGVWDENEPPAHSLHLCSSAVGMVNSTNARVEIGETRSYENLFQRQLNV